MHNAHSRLFTASICHIGKGTLQRMHKGPDGQVNTDFATPSTRSVRLAEAPLSKRLMSNIKQKTPATEEARK